MAFLNLTSFLTLSPAKIAPQPEVPPLQVTEQERSRQLLYWKQKLSGHLPQTYWLGKKNKTSTGPYIQNSYTFPVPPLIKEKIESYATAQGIKVPVLFLAVLRLLLFRYGQQEDLIIGSEIADPSQKEVKHLFPLRLQVQESMFFRHFLEHTQQIVAEAENNSDISYGLVVAATNQTKSVWHSSLFQVLFTWKSTPDVARRSDTSIYKKIEDICLSQLDLQLCVTNWSGQACNTFFYNGNLFTADEIARMAAHLYTLLEAAIANDEQGIAQLSMLTGQERKELLVDFTHRDVLPLSYCAHELFEQQVRQSPHSTALIYQKQAISYQVLNEKANQLAHYLLKLGVGPEKIVGLCLRRSPEFFVGLLAILKAGGAFMPLDPDLPADRFTFLIEDAAPILILTQEGQLNRLLLDKQVPTVYIDQASPLIAKESTANPPLRTRSTDLMYVIYTSGSSGKPKGVLVEHASLISFLQAYSLEIQLRADDRLLQFVPVVFDPMVEDTFCAFYHGAALVLRTDSIMESAEFFLEQCKQWKVSVLNLPVSYWHVLVSELTASADIQLPDCLRVVKVGGERLLREKVLAWKSRFGHFPRLINTYGPTETTIAATMYDCTNLDETADEVPIGFPLANTKAYVLDAYKQPVPLGLVGQLCIGGKAVSRGYLNRDDLTAQKFIPDPFSNRPDAKLYCTGDLVRWLPDGKLDYLGRSDDQVKIRGFRIELGEVESVLEQHPVIKQAVVAVSGSASGEKKLIAYVVTGSQPLEVSVLRNYLKTKMPEYMVPSLFVPLNAFPLTFNGKIDRKALPSPDRFISLSNKVDAPQTYEEQVLAEIWLKLFSVPEVSIHANFFDIGGHSLLAAKLTSQIRASFQCKLPLSWVFANPTIQQQAQYLAMPQNQNQWDTLVPILTVKDKTPLYLIHDGSGDVEYAFQIAQCMQNRQPLYGFRAVGLTGQEEPLQTIEAMADYYINRLLLHQPEGPYHIAAYSGGATIAFEMICKLKNMGKEVGLAAIFDAYPVNLNRFTYQRIGLSYVLRSVANFLLSPELSPLQKFKKIINELPEIISDNWMRIVLRITEQKTSAIKDPATKFHSTLKKAVDTYHFKAYAGDILFVRAIENQARYLRNCHFGWGRYSSQVKVYDLPGNHKDLFRDKQNAQAIAEILQMHLAAYENRDKN